MNIIDHLSRYFLVPHNEVFEDQRKFYRDALKGEDLDIELRKVDEFEGEYKFLSKHLPTIADITIGAVSLVTWNPSYLLWLAVPETWRATEMRSGRLYDHYTRRMLSYTKKIVEKNKAELTKILDGSFEGEAEVGKSIDEFFKEMFGPDDLKTLGVGDSENPHEEFAEEITSEGLTHDIDNTEPTEDDQNKFEQDGGSSRPWDLEDGDGWNKDGYKGY